MVYFAMWVMAKNMVLFLKGDVFIILYVTGKRTQYLHGQSASCSQKAVERTFSLCEPQQVASEDDIHLVLKFKKTASSCVS